MNSLTYDGFGINYGPGSKHLGSRIATFPNAEGSPVSTRTDKSARERDKFGRLFAAAPKLLAVCRKAEEAMAEACNCGECGGCAVAEEIRDTITEATGWKPETTITSAPEPNPLAAALRWALDSLPEDLDHDDRAKKVAANALLSGIPAPLATTTPDHLPDALVALWECVDLLKNSKVRFKICNGGRGNLGEASWYHSVMHKANAVLRPSR